jgi:hypothetical protein
MTILKYFMASWPRNMRTLEVGWRQGLAMVLLMVAIRVVEGLTPTPPTLPKKYQGNGNTLQLLLNESWPVAQGPASTFTFFAPENSAIKVLVLNNLKVFKIINGMQVGCHGCLTHESLCRPCFVFEGLRDLFMHKNCLNIISLLS